MQRDTDLLTEIASGNEQAFARFYRQHYHRLANRARYILKQREQAEEIIQDVFSKIWLQRCMLPEIKDPEAFLFIMARNSCLNQLKANIRKQALEQQYLEQQYLEQQQEQTCLIRSESKEEEVYHWLDEAIAQLPQQQKKVYMLHRVKRKKYSEIADELNLSRETVKKYLQLASQSIKEYLSRQKDSVVSLILLFLFF